MRRIVLMSAALALTATVAFAGEMTGREVMEAVHDRPIAEDTRATVTMTLTDRRGSQRVREIEQYTLGTAEGERRLLFFTAPADVRDTSFMTWSYDDGRSDDQWIYLPALRRIRRISAEARHDSFMGSDFTYDDISGRHPDDDRHELLRRESHRGENTYVVESVPSDGSAPFDRTVTWVIDGEWIGIRREYFDDRDRLYKVLEVEEYEQIDGVWVIPRMTMTDKQRDHSTTMEMREIELNAGLSENIFSERTMQRGVR